MTRGSVVWDTATLDVYIANPQDYIKGNHVLSASACVQRNRPP